MISCVVGRLAGRRHALSDRFTGLCPMEEDLSQIAPPNSVVGSSECLRSDSQGRQEYWKSLADTGHLKQTLRLYSDLLNTYTGISH